MIIKRDNNFKLLSKFSDIVLNVIDGCNIKEFHVHKIILSSGSGFFSEIITPNIYVIDLEFDPVIFDKIIKLIYGYDITIDNNWKKQVEFIYYLKYFSITGINIEQELINIQMPKTNFVEYIQMISVIHLSQKIIDNFATQIFWKYNMNGLSQNLNTQIYNSDKYKFYNIVTRLYQRIKNNLDLPIQYYIICDNPYNVYNLNIVFSGKCVDEIFLKIRQYVFDHWNFDLITIYVSDEINISSVDNIIDQLILKWQDIHPIYKCQLDLREHCRNFIVL